MRRLLLGLCFSAGFLIGTVAQGAWGTDDCATVVAEPSFTGWYAYEGCDYHYSNGVQDAGYDPSAKVFRTYDATKSVWSGAYVRPVVEHFLFGVKTSKLRHGGSCKYSLNGKPISRSEACAVIQLTDDSEKPYVTFIGVGREDLAAAFAATPEATKVRVNSYPSDAWQLQPGFVVSGSPTVYVQNAKGKVLYRGDAPSLKTLVAEVRKADPNYDPSKDPSGINYFMAYLKSIPGWLYFALAGIFLLWRKVL